MCLYIIGFEWRPKTFRNPGFLETGCWFFPAVGCNQDLAAIQLSFVSNMMPVWDLNPTLGGRHPIYHLALQCRSLTGSLWRKAKCFLSHMCDQRGSTWEVAAGEGRSGSVKAVL